MKKGNNFNRKGTILRSCKRCGNEYRPSQGRQKYCGSYRERKGCSIIVRKEDHARRIAEYWKDPKWRAKELKRLREKHQKKQA
jgi:hypothetical protein